MPDVYRPNHMEPTASLLSSFCLDRKTAAAAAGAAAFVAAGAWVFTATSAHAVTGEHDTIGVGWYSAGDVDCDDGDAIDKITLLLASLIWRAVNLYPCFRGLRLAAVWFTGTASFLGLQRRASTLLGRAPVAAAAAAPAG